MISWLPAAHIAERGAHYYLPVTKGVEVDDLPRPAPDHRVPAEGAADLVLRRAADLGEAQGRPRGDARQAARRAARAGPAGPPGGDRQGSRRAGRARRSRRSSPAAAAAEEQMFAGLRTHLGLDEVVAVNVGAAPTPVEVLEFFHAIGIPIGELWGMSETCGVATFNPPERGQARHRRPADAGRRDPPRRGRRGPGQGRPDHARLPQPAGEDRRDDRRGRWLPPATSASSTRTAT